MKLIRMGLLVCAGRDFGCLMKTFSFPDLHGYLLASEAKSRGIGEGVPGEARRKVLHVRPSEADSIYGALDLGTNCCRLLLACPDLGGFSVVDSFTRIVRLGEGTSSSGKLAEPAMERTLRALQVCASKINDWPLRRFRFIATEACRMASNGPWFINKIAKETGLSLEVIDKETEACLAVTGVLPLVSPQAKHVLLFDIGGGSTELIWLFIEAHKSTALAWSSLPFGVVTLAEKFPNYKNSSCAYILQEMRSYIHNWFAKFSEELSQNVGNLPLPDHLLGTSGTITTVCGIHLKLPYYHRSAIDAQWLTLEETQQSLEKLSMMNAEERAEHPCIGPQRADLSLAGCAILSEILDFWPAPRVRVADRGLKEGILTSLMYEDGTYGQPSSFSR